MKIEFLPALWKRFTRLVIQLVSVKTIPAGIATAGYLGNPDVINLTGMLVAWALVVGVRYAEKVKGVMEKAF